MFDGSAAASVPPWAVVALHIEVFSFVILIHTPINKIIQKITILK